MRNTAYMRQASVHITSHIRHKHTRRQPEMLFMCILVHYERNRKHSTQIGYLPVARRLQQSFRKCEKVELYRLKQQ